MTKHQKEPSVCFVCNLNLDKEQSQNLFDRRLRDDGSADCSISTILSTILCRNLDIDGVHSKNICGACFNRVTEFEQLEQRFLDLKYKIIHDFNRACQDHGGVPVLIDGEGEEYSVSVLEDVDDHTTFEKVDEEEQEIPLENMMTLLSSEELDGALSSEPQDKQVVKVERVPNEMGTEEFFDQNSENMVEIVAENDEQYEQLIEQHASISNDDTTSLNGPSNQEINEVENTVEENFIKNEHATQKDEDDSNTDESSSKRKPLSKSENAEDSKPLFTFNGQNFTCLVCPTPDEPLSAVQYDVRTISIHMKAAHNIRVYICDICGDDFRKRNELTEHMDDEHGGTEDGVFQCETCNRIFTNLRLFRIHKRLHYSSSKSFQCNHCDKKYSSKNLLDEHMNMHTGNRPYKCPHCPKDFASKYTLTAHLKIHSNRPRPFNCTQCPKTFFSAQNLQQHEKTHTGVKDFVCDICKKAFGTQHNLEVHKIVHTGYKPFICRTCGKAFARRAEIKDHERTHTGEKPFACDICNMCFAQRSNLTTHKRATHLNDKRYKCEQCDRSFKRRRLLDYHVRAIHTFERPYKCGKCSATFVYPEHYKKHLRIHTGLKPFSCEVCGKAFNSRDNRNAHRFIHSDKKPYECLYCGQGFMRKPLLYAHMQHSGHINDTIVVNQPRIATEVEKQEEENFIEEHITEDSDMAEEHLIIDGPVQFGNESESQAADDPIGDNSMPAEILEGDDLSDVIVTDQIFVTEDGQYIKTEEGLVQIKTKDGEGKGSFAWVNFVNDRES